MRSSNTCPKCGDTDEAPYIFTDRPMPVGEAVEVMSDDWIDAGEYCGQTVIDLRDAVMWYKSKYEAIAELDAWHTGEPPVDAEYPCRFCEQDGHHDGHSGVNLFDGYASDGTYWVDCRNCGSVGPYANTPASAWRAWNIVNKPWREVRP